MASYDTTPRRTGNARPRVRTAPAPAPVGAPAAGAPMGARSASARAAHVMDGNNLVFRTSVGGVSIPSGQTVDLTQRYSNGLNVQPFVAIRITGANRAVSASAVTFVVLVTLQNELFSTLDEFTVEPGTPFNRTFDVPGLRLRVLAQTPSGTGNDTIDLAMFGFKP